MSAESSPPPPTQADRGREAAEDVRKVLQDRGDDVLAEHGEEAHEAFWEAIARAVATDHPLSDAEILLQFAARLGLDLDDGLWRLPNRRYRLAQLENGEFLLTFGQGEGYDGFFVEFRFSEDGNVLSHRVAE